MVDIAHFRSVANSAAGHNPTLSLNSDRSGLLVAGNRIARWIRGMNTTRNRETSRLFIATLKHSYGEQIATQVMDTMSLSGGLATGKPLRLRKVVAALNLAEKIKTEFVKSSQTAAANYERSFAEGVGKTLLEVKLDHISGHLLAMDKESMEAVKAKIDVSELAQRIKGQINLAGKGGQHFITTEKADEIAQRTIIYRVGEAYQNVLMEKLRVGNENSLSQRILQGMRFGSSDASAIDPSRLTPDTVRMLERRLSEKLSDMVYVELNSIKDQGISAAPADAKEMQGRTGIRVTPEKLQELAEDVVGKFGRERLAAAQALQELPIDNPEIKSRMTQVMLHNGVPASMVPAFCRVYPRLSESFLQLGRFPRPSSAELDAALREMHAAFTEITAQGELSSENRDPVTQAIWEVFLTGQDQAQVQSFADQLGKEGTPLRYFVQGAHYFRHDFLQTPEGNREEFGPSYQVAAECDSMLANLMDLLEDRTVGVKSLSRITSRSTLPDDTITMLRNTGVGVPAPDRLGEENRDIRLSDKAMGNVYDKLLAQSRDGSKKVSDGVLKEFSADLGRATYRLNGRDLGTDPQQILQQLREFCTDGSTSQVNEEMLLGISKIAYQASFGSMLGLLAPGREILAPFQGVPSGEADTTAGAARPEYNISKNDQGEVVITMRFSQPARLMTRFDPEAQEPQAIQLKPDISHYGMNLDVSLDKNTFEPRIDKASFDYAFYPEEYVSEYQSD